MSRPVAARPRALAMLALAWSAAAAGGCKRNAAQVEPPHPLLLGTVTVRDDTSEQARPAAIDLGALRGALTTRLLATGLLVAGGPDAGGPTAPVVRVRCEIELEGAEVEDKGVARAAVRLQLQTRPSTSPGAIDQDLTGQGEQIYPIARSARPPHAGGPPARAPAPSPSPSSSSPDKSALFAKLALRVASDLINGLAAREKLKVASPAEVHAAIRADGGELREEAIRVAGERNLRDEVPLLLTLLDDPSEPVRDAALGALIALGDRRAVTVLTKSRSFRDHREMRKILDAIATLGGDEALDYLGFVEQTHDDPEIRDLAKAAKARLERRRGEPGMAAAGKPVP